MIEEDEIKTDKLEYTIKILEDFDLNYLENKFGIAEFERKPSSKFIEQIIEDLQINAMRNRTFLVWEEDGKYIIFDGQHRYRALLESRNVYGLQTFTIVLHIYPDAKTARAVYLSINKAHALKATDTIKGIDDGSIEFLNLMGPKGNGKLDYYGKNRISCDVFRNALHYARTGSHWGGRLPALKETFTTITPEETLGAHKSLDAVYTCAPTVKGTVLSKNPMFKNLLRVTLQYPQLSGDDLVHLGMAMEKSKKLRGVLLRDGSSKKAVLQIWAILQADVLPEFLDKYAND